MANLKFNLKGLEFEGSELGDEQVNIILSHIIVPSMGIQTPDPTATVESFHKSKGVGGNLGRVRNKINDTIQNPISKEEAINMVEPIEPEPLPRTDLEEENRGFSIGEIFAEQLKGKFHEKIKDEDKEEPNYWHTGIKYKGDKGKPHYRTHYDCPKCNNSGRHYIPKGTKFVSCHNCSSKLEVTPATEKGEGFSESYRDEFGSFFHARELVIDNIR